MSYRGRRSRPLGSVRHSLNGIESIPKLPPLNKGSSVDNMYTGVHGNAMGTPLHRGSPERSEKSERSAVEKPKTLPIRGPSRNTSSSRSEGSKSDDSAAAAAAAADKKELKEAQAREKQLLEQIASLQNVITGLEIDIAERAKTNESLEQELKKLAAAESRYKQLYETEVQLHNGTKDTLSSTKTLLTEKEKQIEDLEEQHQVQIKEITATMKKKLDELEKSKNAEIAVLDGKLKRLKSQMADALQGNSWERQQQLDELSKELSRATEEAEMLRAKLRSMAKNGAKMGNPGCPNCESLSARVQHLDRTITEKDKAVRELKVICSKFEKQLNQKDNLKHLISERKAIK